MKTANRLVTAKVPLETEDAIYQFRKQYAFLSNFYPVEIEVEGITFPSVENAYQALKVPKEYRRMFIGITPGEAKRLSRKLVKQEEDCDEHFWGVFYRKRVEVMETLLRKKFQIPELREKLIQTHPKTLIEGTTWGDTFWGVDLRKPANNEWRFEGENMLGKLLMKIRAELRGEK